MSAMGHFKGAVYIRGLWQPLALGKEGVDVCCQIWSPDMV